MFPVLFHLGPLTIYSYGFFIALGYLACLASSIHLGKKEGIPGTVLADLGFYLLLTGFIGCRILFVITRLSYFMEHPMEVFYVWEGGLVFFGGLILATAFCLWYVRRHKLPLWRTLDIAAIAVPLAHAFGRLGCFAAGCCHGSACELPWAVTLNSSHVQEDLRGIPIHPVQLYESLLLFALFGFLFWRWHRRRFAGEIVLFYFMIYPIIRSVTEMFRGDAIRGFVIPGLVSTSQFISLLVFVATLTIYWTTRSRVAATGTER